MNDAVFTHAHHPDLCGVAKFSTQLARRLGVSVHYGFATVNDYGYPLLSIKGAEQPSMAIPWPPFDLFAHDATASVLDLLPKARRVYAANRVIARALRQAGRSDVIEAWCPAMLQGNPTRATYNVLTFGMAHKLRLDAYRDLKATLDAEHGTDYTVSVSTAVHEGSPWDATADVADKLRGIFGDRLRVLGYLADDALARELDACDAVALYFPDGVRENNTTYWAAVEARKRIFTNYDADSPTAAHPHTWDRLLEVLRAA